MGRIKWIVAGLVLAVGMPALADEGGRIWLRYRCDAQPSQFGMPVRGQSCSIVAQRPEKLALPELEDAQPLFARWKRTVSVNEEWFVLARAKKNGAYTLLYADTNLDGSLADEKPITGEYDNYGNGSGGYYHVQWPPVMFVRAGEDGPVTFHLAPQFSESGSESSSRRLYIGSAGWYEGQVMLDGKLWALALVDSDTNGRFNDTSQDTQAGDVLAVRSPGKFVRPPSSSTQGDDTHYLGKLLEFQGKLYEVEAAEDGSSVSLRPAGKVPFGTVRVGEMVTQVNLYGPAGQFRRTIADGKMEVPVGTYRLQSYTLQRKSDNGTLWAIENNWASGEKPFTVTAEKETDLGFGKNFQANLSDTNPRRGGEHSFSFEIRSESGSSLSLTCNGQRPAAPKVRIRNDDESYNRTFSMEYG